MNKEDNGKMKKLLTVAVSLVFLLCGAATVLAVQDISPEDASDMLDPNSDNYDPNAYILDCRSECEYRWNGHCAVPEGKIKNIPWKFWEYNRQVDNYVFTDINKFFDAAVYRFFDPANDTLIVVCRSGGRAGAAAGELEDLSQPASNRLEALGFFDVRRMDGGFSFGWEPAGLPVVSDTEGIWKPSDHRGRSLK
jgi:rhodanese-related sulfurtransferase